MTNSRDQLFERKWQPTKGRANHKKHIIKSKSKPLKKSEKSRTNYKKTREKVRANQENNTSKSTSKPQTPEQKHEQTIKETRANHKKKTLEKGRANHKQKKHGPRAREN